MNIQEIDFEELIEELNANKKVGKVNPAQIIAKELYGQYLARKIKSGQPPSSNEIEQIVGIIKDLDAGLYNRLVFTSDWMRYEITDALGIPREFML